MASVPQSDAACSDQPAELAEADLAQAWKDLQKGEKTAEALEANLTHLEKKLDDLIAGFEESERAKLKLNEAGDADQDADSAAAAAHSTGGEKDDDRDGAGKS